MKHFILIIFLCGFISAYGKTLKSRDVDSVCIACDNFSATYILRITRLQLCERFYEEVHPEPYICPPPPSDSLFKALTGVEYSLVEDGNNIEYVDSIEEEASTISFHVIKDRDSIDSLVKLLDHCKKVKKLKVSADQLLLTGSFWWRNKRLYLFDNTFDNRILCVFYCKEKQRWAWFDTGRYFDWGWYRYEVSDELKAFLRKYTTLFGVYEYDK